MASLKTFTIESDDEIEPETFSSDEEEMVPTKGSKKKAPKKKDSGFSFKFDDGTISSGDDESESESDDDEGSDSDSEDGDENKVVDTVRSMPHAEDRSLRARDKASKKSEKEKAGLFASLSTTENSSGMNEEEEAEYFDEVMDAANDGSSSSDKMFSELSLSRPLLRAVEAMGYVTPTPIQAAVIPLAMAGRDVCASAVTGSGKTAAFSLPFLERLLFRRKDVATIRVLVVSPTRELATQTYEVLQKLTQFTDITSALICGGKKDVKSQEATLRLRPDIVICTPGRLIDHLRNSRSVNIDDLDVLVLDEVDRLLDLGFQEEVEELVRHCPTTRQTLLFSATMTPKVEDLVKLSLRKPIRVKTASSNTTVAPRLIQEFIKLREENEREAIMAALICRTFKKRVIAFFETKHETHRFYTVLLLLGVKACEMHGDVTQVQRYLALERFRKGDVDVMVCTDVAARGLDIPGVQTVLNAEMPRNASTYVHRVGRTARAGCGGRAVTLVSDSRRKVMKEVLKSYTGADGSATGENASKDNSSGGQVLSRTVAPPVIAHYVTKISESEAEIEQIMREEKINAKIKAAEAEVERAENMMNHQAEISARPARTWFQTETQKTEIKQASVKRAREEEEQLLHNDDEEESNNAMMESVKKAQRLARSDDYKLDEKAALKRDKDHRLSRKKRRRQEALKQVEEANAVVRKDIESAPKRAKVAARDNATAKHERASGELGVKKQIVRGDNGKRKIVRQSFAVGGLDNDLLANSDRGIGGSGVSKKALKLDARKAGKDFTEFDPTKRLRKQGKIGHNSFKSKSKFKRRK